MQTGQILSIIHKDRQWKVEIQPLLKYEDLPRQFVSTQRNEHSTQNHLWWSDEAKTSLLDPADLVRPVSVWLGDLLRPINFDYIITEILYKLNRHFGSSFDEFMNPWG